MLEGPRAPFDGTVVWLVNMLPGVTALAHSANAWSLSARSGAVVRSPTVDAADVGQGWDELTEGVDSLLFRGRKL